MPILILTRNTTGKKIRIDSEYIIEYEEVEMNEDPEAKAKGSDEKKGKKTATVIRRTKGKDLFVKQTPDEIDKLIQQGHELRFLNSLVSIATKMRESSKS